MGGLCYAAAYGHILSSFYIIGGLRLSARIAYNLDRPFQCCKACGKQALTMAMALAAMLQALQDAVSSIPPANGLLPFLPIILCPAMDVSLFYHFDPAVFMQQPAKCSLLCCQCTDTYPVYPLGIAMTFLSSYLLSATVLRGVSSSFTLEMPPYRRPQIGKVILRSVTDRTLFVLGRAAAVAAPAGLILWLLANVSPSGISLLSRISLILDPLGRLLGMDGVILTAFILGFPPTRSSFPLSLWPIQPRGI